MRLRFTIRDLLWLMLVVALGLGWFVRERELEQRHSAAISELEQTRERVARWRGTAGALEEALKGEGWEVRSESSDASSVFLEKEEIVPGGIRTRGRAFSTTSEPSLKDE